MTAYITATGSCLPGAPVTSDEIEDYIGRGVIEALAVVRTMSNC